MRTLFAACILLFLSTISSAAEQPTVIYDSIVLTEDVTWSGSILVRGFVVVSPHATLRLDPGTVVRFAATATQQLPSLIVQGRLHIAGTSGRPVVLKADQHKPARGSWGGLVFLSTGKRNLLEHCRIEYAETGIDLRFSTLNLKSVSIVNARTALLSHDGIVQMTGSTVSDSETGFAVYNSEFECKDTTVTSCLRGCSFVNSAVLFTSVKIMNNQKIGLAADGCRIKISGGEFSGNALGAHIKDGEGQIIMSSFIRNRQTALHLSGARAKIMRCLFAENSQDALRTDDGRALLLSNAFSLNGGYNLYNAGSEVVGALRNWWGSADQPQILQKIYDSARDNNSGAINIYPWLNEKPPLIP